ncbi:MAG TPA: alpha/beta hydrolase [Verrucomicrobiae bacterium]|nr:alpha/beta hydrolase [Verrucomicrobiae bacterium]
MQVFIDGDATLDVRVDGTSGDPVVLIHGFPLSREIWNAQAEALARTHRVVLPNLRGAGASSAGAGPYLMESLAADVAAALDALAIERATIVGHSLGGYVALAFARMFSERVDRLALVCSRLAADSADQAAARGELADRIEREGSIAAAIDAYLPRLLAPETFAMHPQIEQRVRAIAMEYKPEGAAALLRGMALRDPASDIVADLQMPMAMIAGAHDVVLSVAEARDVAHAFPAGRLVVCEHSGHLPMLEEPQRVSEALQALLERPG